MLRHSVFDTFTSVSKCALRNNQLQAQRDGLAAKGISARLLAQGISETLPLFHGTANPGAFHWTEPVSLNPQKPNYSGKVVILVDEVSLSQAEYTAMAFRAAPRSAVVGSTTSGNDGNVSAIALPSGLRTMISGIGVFYPNKRPTQRIGIAPDVEVRPTIAAIRARRDELLEEALRQILGPEVPGEEIERMYKQQ